MSIATLKKKTEHLYNNQSVGYKNFSLNGTRRPQGYIGQTFRPCPRTLARGNTFRGHGGNNGQFNKGTNPKGILFGLTDYNNPKIIKSSVVGTEGMMERRFMWSRRPFPYSSTKPNSYLNTNSQSDRIATIETKAVQQTDNYNKLCASIHTSNGIFIKTIRAKSCNTLPAKYMNTTSQCNITKEHDNKRHNTCYLLNNIYPKICRGCPLPN